MDYNLDSLQLIKHLDKSGISTSIARLGDQLEHAWNETQQLELPDEYRLKKNIVLTGMGGSALGGRVVAGAFFNSLRVPFQITTETSVPHWVNADSLVIVSSYSGNTAETIESLRDAQKKQASILIITTGGKLAEYAEKENIPAYVFDPFANPSGQPRMALGYSFGALLGILAKLHYISLETEDIQKCVTTIEKAVEEYSYGIAVSKNQAKLQAHKLFNKFFIGVGSEHLTGVVHTFKNQLNENAKTFATYFDLPELNHHLLEGLKFPSHLKTSAQIIFFESELYSGEYKKRYEIVKDIVNQNGIQYSEFTLKSETKLEQVFEALVFGSYVSLYLALLHGIDPSPIPWVDYLKEKLE